MRVRRCDFNEAKNVYIKVKSFLVYETYIA